MISTNNKKTSTSGYDLVPVFLLLCN